ncbi:MAG TPA: hypothetical protein VMS86_08200 [Thermoanaerobaculia bacterium]|nr:hypothetical protein [Thermoanaerobaculia bacterium]
MVPATGIASRAAAPVGPTVPPSPRAHAADRAAATPLAERIARIALPVACAASWWTIAALHREPPVAAEARYLGLLCAAVLYAALQARLRTGSLYATGAVLLAAIPWALPGTPDRGAAVGVLLAALLAIAAAGAASVDRPRASTVCALALGAQLLARGGDLLSPTAFDVIALVGLAAAAAAATLVLAERRGVLAAVLAAATAFALGPGFTPMSALALAVPAAATLAADRERPAALRTVLGAALFLPLAWDFERGVLLALCAVALAGAPWARLVAGLAGVVAYFAPEAQRFAAFEGPLWLLVLLPIVSSEPSRERRARWAALAIALGTAALSPDRAALVAPAVLLAATVAGTHPVWVRLQATWTGVLAGTVAVLAAYPWLRSSPLPEVTALLGLGRGWQTAVVVLLLFGAAALASRLLAPGERRAQLAPRALAILLVPLALAQHAGTSALPISRQPVELDSRRAVWSERFAEPVRVSAITLDSTLSNAATVPADTLVAEILLRTAGGDRVLPIRAGTDTGEWAARRADVEAVPGFVAPPAFLGWVEAGGGFFGQRYRARLAVEPTGRATAIELRLAPGIPPDLVLTIFHLELSR